MPGHHGASQGEPADHPAESLLAAYLDGQLMDDERSLVDVHLDACAECRRALADAADVLDTQLPDAIRPAPATRPPRRARRVWLSVGIALAASVAAFAVLRQSPVGDDTPVRTRDATPITLDERIPRLGVVTPADGSVGVAPGVVFTWRHADVDRYSFRLLTEDGAPLWSQETTDTTVTVPRDVRLEPGRSYFWRVDALAAGIGASTRAQQFTVAP